MPKGKHILSQSNGKHFFGTVKVGEKGQVVIPKEARDIFDIKPGEMLLVFGDEAGGLVITKSDVINDVTTKVLGG